eukprot:COSAG01_NODE_27905_length_674_cov_0.786087_1_plen_65_part_01
MHRRRFPSQNIERRRVGRQGGALTPTMHATRVTPFATAPGRLLLTREALCAPPFPPNRRKRPALN